MSGTCAACRHWLPYPLRRGVGVCGHPEGRDYGAPNYSSAPACPKFELLRLSGEEPDGRLYWCDDCGQAFHQAELQAHVGHRVYKEVLVLPDEFEHILAAD